jgi:hypothetical protein
MYKHFTLNLQNKFEAIHNKDYSVVKTSRAGPSGLVLFYYLFVVIV